MMRQLRARMGWLTCCDLCLNARVLAVMILAAWSAAGQCAEQAGWKVGLARAKITPQRPVVLLGYGDRTRPFEAVAADIYAKALALEDRRGQRAVIVTADLVGFQAAVVTDEVCRRIGEKTGLQRKQLLFNASHTHTGPLVSLDPWSPANPVAHAPMTPDDIRETIAYTHWLQDQLVQLVGEALARLEPARLSWGTGRIEFPMNRRLPQGGRVVMSENPAGPTDRSVPVLRIDTPDGKLRGVLFGCACHNTALTGRDNVIAGDYAGFAQEHVERQHPGTQAMFMSGCGADANPHPRGSMDIARQHGASLGGEVCRVLQAEMRPIQGDLIATFREVELPLQALSRAQLEERAALPSAEAVMARHILGVRDQGEALPRSYRAPLAVWQFGEALTLVALPAEPVADYVSLVGQAIGRDKLWVAGFNNDCFGYLPTAQVVREGGHEAIGITLWIWGQNLRGNAGFFAPEVERVVVDGVRELAQQAGRPVPDTPPAAASQTGEQGALAPSGSSQSTGGAIRGLTPPARLPTTEDSNHSVFPEADWVKISPEQAGLDAEKFRLLLAQAHVHGGTWGGVNIGENDWGAVLTRCGYLVHSWGNPQFKQPSASLGKCIVRALFGITVEAGLIKPDEPIYKTWTGRGELSHAHKYLDQGEHRTLTWRHLLEHQGGFVLESGYHWRTKTVFHAQIPDGVRWTGDPLFDNYAHTPPGAVTRYSSGGYVRLGQALTAVWNRDLKEVLDERLFGPLGIPAERWDWLTAEQVHRTHDFYPDYPGYGEYVDPPYQINGHVVRGGAGWIVMSAEDLARFGLLIATGGVWKGKRLVGAEWLRGHAGLDIHVVAGDPDTLVSIAKINAKGFPFGQQVGTQGRFSFPKELLLNLQTCAHGATK